MVNAVKVFTLRLCISAYYIHFKRVKVKIFTAFTIINIWMKAYLENTLWVAEHCDNIDLSAESMVIGTSAIIETELDGIVGMNTGIFNNPFISWGRYRKRDLHFELPISFQFHHTQMDGSQAGRFLENLQKEINVL